MDVITYFSLVIIIACAWFIITMMVRSYEVVDYQIKLLMTCEECYDSLPTYNYMLFKFWIDIDDFLPKNKFNLTFETQKNIKKAAFDLSKALSPITKINY